MIGQIRGIIVAQQPPVLVVDVQGVGYEVNVPLPVFFGLPQSPQPMVLFTHLVVREDAQQLYGFAVQEDRDWFRELIKISGVGPRMGLALLSAMSAQSLCETITHQHIGALQKVPGVGKKTAERLVIELEEKCRKWLAKQTPVYAAQGQTESAVEHAAEAHQAEHDAHAALMALGYKAAEASKVLRRVFSPNSSSEELIRRALREMVQA